MENYPGAVAEALLETGAFKVSMDPLFTWASGIKSPIYCDLRCLNSHVQARRYIIEAFVTMFPWIKSVDVVAGTATGAISWGAWVAEAIGKPFIYIRKEAKGYGAQKRIEGLLEPGQTVALIEDHISTGGSSIRAVEALRSEGQAVVEHVFAINTNKMKAADENFAAADLKLHTVVDSDLIVEVAARSGYITQEQAEMITDFRLDPPSWAAKHGLE